MEKEVIGEILEKAKKIQNKIVEYRRTIHQKPELKYEEYHTADLVVEELASLGMEVQRKIGDLEDIKAELRSLGDEPGKDIGPTGVLGILQGKKGEGRTVLLRADMDALPVTETEDQSHLPVSEGFQSEHEGIMHACGHDAHVAMLLGAAHVLSKMREQFKGTIKFLFQPAEEGGNGAKIMRKAGVLECVDAVFGIHVWSDLTAGKFRINKGEMLAAADKIKLKMKGGGGHGSAPHETTDPLMASSELISVLYKMNDREIDTFDPSVISITKMTSGTTWNVIPSKATMAGTIRTFDKQVRRKIIERIKEFGNSIADLYDLHFSFEDEYLGPPTVNSEEEAEIAITAATELFGEEDCTTAKPDMGAEDFAYYLEEVPGCFVFLGTRNEEKGTDSPHHNPKFDVDESALYKGAALHSLFALKYLEKG